MKTKVKYLIQYKDGSFLGRGFNQLTHQMEKINDETKAIRFFDEDDANQFIESSIYADKNDYHLVPLKITYEVEVDHEHISETVRSS